MASKFLYALVLLYAINTALAIKCYSCDSSKSSTCNIGVLSFTQDVVDCSQSDGSAMSSVLSFIPKNCIKLVAIDKNGTEYVARHCGVAISGCNAIAKSINFVENFNIKSIDCLSCDTDKCNTGVRSSSGGGVLAALGVAAACLLFLV